jgi:chromosome segregation ATPase
MSIKNMQRTQSKAGADCSGRKEELDKREEALKEQQAALERREQALATKEQERQQHKDEQVQRLTSALLGQGHELKSARQELEKLRKEHWVLTEQLTSGSRRLAHYASRYLSENAKVWDLTASTTSTASTVSSLSHRSTGSSDSNPVLADCAQGLDGTPLKADDSTDYSTFPSTETLSCDPCEFLRKLRSDLKRLGVVDKEQLKPASVLALSSSVNHLANELPVAGWAENPELHERIEEVWRSAEEHIGRVEGGLRTLYARLELVLASHDVARIDPALLIRSVSQALLEILPDVAHVSPAVKEVLDSVRQLSDDLAPVAKRIRLAESGFKIKEQRHALKVDLLEKKLQRLTGTLTDVQLASRRISPTPTHDEAAQTSAKLQSLEDQVVELTLGKFDAEKACEQLRQEEQHRAKKKPDSRAAPDRMDLHPFDELGVFSAPAFALGSNGPSEWSAFPSMHNGTTAPCMFYPPLDLTAV